MMSSSSLSSWTAAHYVLADYVLAINRSPVLSGTSLSAAHRAPTLT